MDEDGEVLEIGARRGRGRLPIIGASVVLAAVLGYLAFGHHGGPSSPDAARSPTASAARPSASTPVSTPTLPPWPQRNGACGNTAFLPLVRARPLDQHTGIRAVVGDRLATVDLDTGAVRAVAGLPRGRFVSQIAHTAQGTYALLASCATAMGDVVSVARLDRSGALHNVARGRYGWLIDGGDHPWAVLSNDSDRPIRLDPLDGGPLRTLPANFGPIGAYRDLIIGAIGRPGAPPDAAFPIRVLDPVTGRTMLDLGPATSATVSNGLVVWTAERCDSCRVHSYDLATGKHTVTARAAWRVAAVWGGIVSPDGRTAAFLRQRSTPSTRYALDHPGNPNEIVTLDLRSGAVQVVPGVVLWSKAFPGLAFSADGRWLLISLDEGSGVRLLVWRPGLATPLQSPARLTGPVAYTPGVSTVLA